MRREVLIAETTFDVEVRGNRLSVDGKEVAVDAKAISANELSLLLDGRVYRCLLDRTPWDEAIIVSGKRYPFVIEDPRAFRGRKARGAGSEGPAEIKSSMPGRVLRILAKDGDNVAAGQGLLVVEAMKMQNEIKAPRAGRVKLSAVKEGDTVNAGQLIAIIE